MSVAADLNPYTASVLDASDNLVVPASVKKRSIQQPKVTGKDDERYARMLDKVSCMWADSEEDAYDQVRGAILKLWTESEPSDKKFFEKAVDLFVEKQKRPIMDDPREWSEHLEKSGIDSMRYCYWAVEQYDLLAREKKKIPKIFEDMTLERFSMSLITANWKDANDDSAIVNHYLQKNTQASLKPQIYLGPLGKSHLAVRVNMDCLEPQRLDVDTLEPYDEVSIRSEILLGMRYVPLERGISKQTMLFYTIGNVFRMPRSRYILNTTEFEEGNWKDTGIALVLEIQKMHGKPNRLYMVQDSYTRFGTLDEASWKSLETSPFTLAELKNETNLHLQPYDGISERPTLQLKRLSTSELEIVHTGQKGNWFEGVPPIGLYPVKFKRVYVILDESEAEVESEDVDGRTPL